jgi:iron(III) transport system substrate-binding protein
MDDSYQPRLAANDASVGSSGARKCRHPRLLYMGFFVATLASMITFDAMPSARAAASPTYDALVAAAKQEGELILYSSESDKQVDDTNKAFEARYGIKVQSSRFSAGALTSRYDSEHKSGVIQADAVVVANEPFITDNPSWWLELNESKVPGYDGYPAAAKGPRFLTLNYNVIGIAWNTSLVKPADAPKGYLDVVNNPAFATKGSIVYADPRATPSAMNLFKVLVDRYGADFFQKLRDRGVAIAASSSPGAQQIAAGANKVLIGNFANNAQTVISVGAPVAYLAVSDPATGVDNIVALSNGGKHPNAARLYAAFRISEDGQKVMCLAKGSTSPLGDLPGCEPAVP